MCLSSCQLGVRYVPGCILHIPIYLYNNQDMCIRWSDKYSAKSKVTNGFRQRGLIYPGLLRLLNRLFTCSVFHSPLAYSRVKLKWQRLYHCVKMERGQTSLTIDQLHFYHSYLRYCEKISNERLQQLLNTNNIVSNSQYGFRAHMSTVHGIN